MQIISPENRIELIKRLKSFMWRFSVMFITIAVSFLADNLNLFEIGGEAQVIIGLFLGEVTKYLNNKQLLPIV